MAARKKNGQFEKGSSGNEYGRPKAAKPNHRIPAKNRDAILRIAEREIEITLGGKKEKMTLFEANVLRLALDGAHGGRVSARQFAAMVEDTAKEDLQMGLRTRLMMEDMNRVRDEHAEMKRKLGRKGGVMHVEDPTLSWAGISDEARLDDGRRTLTLDEEQG